MAMFARRSLQRLLDALKETLSLAACVKLAHELNRQNTSALGFEWELALLFALSRVGSITYEAESHPGPRRPDITFAEEDGPIRFVADVTMVSDAGLEEENPVMRFSQSLHRLKRKYRLPGSLNYHVAAVTDGPTYHNRKTRLKLPKLSEFDTFLSEHVGPEFQRIADEKRTNASIKVDEPGVEFSVTYDETQRHSGGGYPAYTAAQSRTRNPVYTALKAKTSQLKKSGATDPRGIFLCDGGCALLSKTGRQHMQVGLDEVIAEFFRQNSSVAFVVVLGFPPSRVETFTGIVKELRITGQLYSNPRATNALPDRELIELINRGLAQLPQPAATPRDALHWIGRAAAHEGQTYNTVHYSGGFMTESIKLSARQIQEVLAGRTTAQELFSQFDNPGRPFRNPFEAALRQGLTIESVNLTKLADADDDLLEVRFGLADPAISKLRTG
jgi:hypothetical protein